MIINRCISLSFIDINYHSENILLCIVCFVVNIVYICMHTQTYMLTIMESKLACIVAGRKQITFIEAAVK